MTIHINRSMTQALASSERMSLAIKIAHMGYQISLYVAENGPLTNLTGQELRVYAPGQANDLTDKMCAELGFPAGGHVDATAENIRLAMGWIEHCVSVDFQSTDLPISPLDKALAEANKIMEDMGAGRKFLPFEKGESKQVSVKRMPSIPAGDNPFHHDAMSMGTTLVRGWIAMHPGYDAASPEEGTQHPVRWMYLVNQRTGNRFRLDIGEDF